MISKAHQKLVNALASALESERQIKIVKIDIRGTPELFDAKYRRLPAPGKYGDRTPDLVGQDSNGTLHLGEVETDMAAENLDDQLKSFSGRTMTSTGAPVPLHVLVPESIKSQMDQRVARLGLTDKIQVWSMPGC